MLRSWNQKKDTWDPFRRLYLSSRGRRLDRVQSDTPLFLVELDQSMEPIDRVAFKCSAVLASLSNLPRAPESMRFEGVELRGVRFIG